MSPTEPTHFVLSSVEVKKLTESIGEFCAIRSSAVLIEQAFSSLEKICPGALISYENLTLDLKTYEITLSQNDSRSQNIAQLLPLLKYHPYLDYTKAGGRMIAVRPTDLIPEGEWQNNPLFNEFYLPRQIPYGLFSTIIVPETGLITHFSLVRELPFSDSEQLLVRLYLEELKKIMTRLEASQESSEFLFSRNCQRYGLTKRETEVIFLVFRGKPDKLIAQTLGNSPHTVRHLMENIFRKMKVHSRGQAISKLLSKPPPNFAQ